MPPGLSFGPRDKVDLHYARLGEASAAAWSDLEIISLGLIGGVSTRFVPSVELPPGTYQGILRVTKLAGPEPRVTWHRIPVAGLPEIRTDIGVNHVFTILPPAPAAGAVAAAGSVAW
jgi:hypothetical protein